MEHYRRAARASAKEATIGRPPARARALNCCSCNQVADRLQVHLQEHRQPSGSAQR
eukprot:CAMPEP_0171081284 /NCGR_PEP_ID=MMETSP0766_2-20121228/16403_1 /TAXON_ID=439317 /ORGANISM="Gambierdiscus australes, Strain CAWD 149" /LENGTH=55 /DNA_ID=CAMNT_0011538579 /DNA_START=125 /DNA_END=289 /DNA_ORIENTATION=+